MHNIKKLLALLLAVVMVAGLFVGCTGTETPTTKAPETTTDDTTDYDTVFEGNCIYHDARDNDNWDNCL